MCGDADRVRAQSGHRLLSARSRIGKCLILKGEMLERSIRHAWKACVGETLPWVRIPLSPPVLTHPRRILGISYVFAAGLMAERNRVAPWVTHRQKPAEYDDGFNARSRDVSRGWSPATRRKSIARIRLGQRAQPQRRFDDRRPERVRRRRRQEVACRRNEGPGRPVRVLRSFAAPVSMASTRQVPRSITGIASPESRSS
jgi:hypothetical protein